MPFPPAGLCADNAPSGSQLETRDILSDNRSPRLFVDPTGVDPTGGVRPSGKGVRPRGKGARSVPS
ncbi:hypothetical protein GCM10009733_027480 [Nonomuraea maheshkhaliensis]|uniref:Uncharacterized protein n=1 Tax=Nonomuraea maheshkhaliensis TaxID=419590 RepID=A0ABN2F447_9ACTN